MNEKVSVIIPVYKVEEYVGKCISSVMEQTYSNLEIIVVVDMSCKDDRSPEICNYFAGLDPRVVILNQKNRGLSGARNDAIDMAKGTYIMFLDGDDHIETTMIETMVVEAERNSADLVIAGVEYDYGRPINNMIRKESYMINRYKAFEMLLDPEYTVPMRTAWGKLYHRKIWEKIRYKENVYCEDMFAIHHIIMTAERIMYNPTKFYRYVQLNTDSLDRSKFNLRKAIYIEAVTEWVEVIKRYFPDLIEKAFIFKIDSICSISMQMMSIERKEALPYMEEYIKFLNECRRNKEINRIITFKQKIKVFLIRNRMYKFLTIYAKVRKII